MQSGPHCTDAILQVHAVIMGRNTHQGILFLHLQAASMLISSHTLNKLTVCSGLL